MHYLAIAAIVVPVFVFCVVLVMALTDDLVEGLIIIALLILGASITWGVDYLKKEQHRNHPITAESPK